MNKNPRKTATEKYNPSVPLDTSKYLPKDNDCFGLEWDMRDMACYQCADREICSILTKNINDKQAKAIEEEIGSHYLDEANLDAITDDFYFSVIKSGETTTSELIMKLSSASKCSDRVAIIEHIKRFIKSNDNVYTKDGLVWLK